MARKKRSLTVDSLPATDPPCLILVNGPTGAGKSTAVRALMERHGSRGDFAVLERDMFAELAGRSRVAPGSDVQRQIWKTALPVLVAASKAYLRRGVSVVVVLTYTADDLPAIDKHFGRWEPLHVCLFPSERVNKNRRVRRIKENGSNELIMAGWDDFYEFRSALESMIDQNMFDEVIDSTRLKPAQVADRLAALL